MYRKREDNDGELGLWLYFLRFFFLLLLFNNFRMEHLGIEIFNLHYNYWIIFKKKEKKKKDSQKESGFDLGGIFNPNQSCQLEQITNLIRLGNQQLKPTLGTLFGVLGLGFSVRPIGPFISVIKNYISYINKISKNKK